MATVCLSSVPALVWTPPQMDTLAQLHLNSQHFGAKIFHVKGFSLFCNEASCNSQSSWDLLCVFAVFCLAAVGISSELNSARFREHATNPMNCPNVYTSTGADALMSSIVIDFEALC